MPFAYRIEKKSYDAKADVESDLNALGAGNWELIWLDVQQEERGSIGSTGPDDPGTPGKLWHLTGIFKKAT